jgi:hypothetical protein
MRGAGQLQGAADMTIHVTRKRGVSVAKVAKNETVRAPTQIRLSDSDTTIVATAINGSSMAFEKQAMHLHHPINAFDVRP